MDEKTRQLRDIFVDVAGDDTVTERQERTRGSLASEEAVDDRLRQVVESMRERYEFRTSLDTDDLVTVIRGFFAGASDAEVAGDIEGDPARGTIARARLDLHLVTEDDRDAPFDLGELRNAMEADRSNAEIADGLDVSESTVRRYRQVVETDLKRRVVNDRFREEFERLLADRDLEERLTEDVRETGLEDATDGMETNVSF